MATEHVVGIAAVKDEVDVIEATVRAMAAQVDALIVADNASSDGTYELLLDLADELPLTITVDPEVGYYQSRRMTALAARAAGEGATWVVPFDADEAWYSPFGRIADVLAEHPDTAVATAALYDHVATGADPDAGTPFERMLWRRREPAPLQKVACRPMLPATIHQGNHGASFPTGTLDGLLIVRHFPYRSDQQFVSKVRNGAAAYAATDLPEDAGAHWRQYGRILDERGPEVLVQEVFRHWFYVDDPASDPTLVRDPVTAAAWAHTSRSR